MLDKLISCPILPKLKRIPLVFISFLILAACALPEASVLPTLTLIPTPVLTPHFSSHSITCSDLDVTWATADWPAVLKVLSQLEAAGLTCGENSLVAKRYAARVNYALTLENGGEIEAAIEQYRAALAVDGRRHEALNALYRLDALPDPTPPACNPGDLAPYVPPPALPEAFVSTEGDQFVANGQPFVVRGVNYYPRHAPWDRFLTEGDLDEMAEELDLIASANFNTLRVFLWYDPLFTCAPEDAIPSPETFAKLDAFIALARERGLRLVVTLNDLPDLFFRPLYTDRARYDAQTAFIVSRYRDEPTVLAWDLRNEGDLDYGSRADETGNFERETVLAWLAHTAELVRAHDDRHLVTAGWWGNAIETDEIVDVLSLHHWTGAPELVSRIETLKAKSTRPILVEEVGFPSWGEGGEMSQAQMLGEVVGAAEESGVAGWLVWAAFDFAPADGQAAGQEHCFGLWRVDLTAKPAVEALPVEAVLSP